MALIEKKKSRLEALSCYVTLSQLKETEINLLKQGKAILLLLSIQGKIFSAASNFISL